MVTGLSVLMKGYSLGSITDLTKILSIKLIITQMLLIEVCIGITEPVKVVEKANSIFPELRLPAPGRTFTSFVKKFFVDKNDEQKKLTEIVKNLVTSKVLPQQITILTLKVRKRLF